MIDLMFSVLTTVKISLKPINVTEGKDMKKYKQT